MTPILKEYLLSSVTTFVATFLTVLAANVSTLDLNTISIGAITGIILTAIRAAVKAVIEMMANKRYAAIPTSGGLRVS